METRRSKRMKLQQPVVVNSFQKPRKHKDDCVPKSITDTGVGFPLEESRTSSSKYLEKPTKVEDPIKDLSTDFPSGRPRRSTTARKVDYLEERTNTDESPSSSSDDSDEDVDLSFITTMEQSRARKRTSTSPTVEARETKHVGKKLRDFAPVSSSSSDSQDSSSECDEVTSKMAVKKKKTVNLSRNKKKIDIHQDAGDINWPKCRKASIARKTGNPSGSQVVKSGLRIAAKLKPQQPWKKNLANYEADRRLAKGERRMKEYRKVASAYAQGKFLEVSYDECFKIHEEMKKAYHEGRKILEAIEKTEKKSVSREKDSSSEDEWEEMERFHPVLDEHLKVTLDEEEENIERDWWVVYLRQEVNKKIREMWENTHKVHVLCYLAHLKFIAKVSLDESLIPSLMISQLPSGYLQYVGDIIPMNVMQKLTKWFKDAFRPLSCITSNAIPGNNVTEEQIARYPATNRLACLIASKTFESDLDRATLLFCLLSGMQAVARICVNSQVVKRKWDEQQKAVLKTDSDTLDMHFSSNATSSAPNINIASVKPAPKKSGTKRKVSKSKLNFSELRNYWVEYWHPREKRWICIDPLYATVDEPLVIHENASQPITYVFAADNKNGVCDVTQRYAIDYVKQDFRRRRTDANWLHATLSLSGFAADNERKKWEKMQMYEDLIKRPLPTTMSEFKNHPLYVLEKDLLKFEAIYPSPGAQKPLGQIRGHNVYPRSTVFTLQGENNWLKLARSVKVGEMPYKVVKARPDLKVPVDERVEQFLNVFGYWQTEPYRRPPLENGKIPHNKYGNVYMFNENMCPLQCVHLKMTGLLQIARKINKQCVPAVVGWAFDGGWTHPVIDGAIVLEKDENLFRKEWKKIEAGRADREDKKRMERIYDNWRKLIKGILRASHIKKKFNANKEFEKINDNTYVHELTDSALVIDNGATFPPLTGFSLDDFMKNK